MSRSAPPRSRRLSGDGPERVHSQDLCDDSRTKNGAISYLRLIGTIVLCAIGMWIAASGRAPFRFGGDEYGKSDPIFVDARGADAIAIGAVIIALGIVNLALAIRGPRRIPVFWSGAGLLGAAIVYGLVKVIAEVTSVFTSSP